MRTNAIEDYRAGSRRFEGNRPTEGSLAEPGRASLHGLLLLDKPAGITSFAATARVRQLLRVDKVGHCGTLDPFATGLLLICINQATRIVDLLSLQDKTYRCLVRLGIETDTLDRTGAVTAEFEGDPSGEEELREVLRSFCGTHEQAVPRYSAVRVQGRRLHRWTRQGVDVAVPSREVRIHRLELLKYQWPEAVLEVDCSKGTYVRQLAADIGGRLGCGAHLSELRRLASGRFHLDQAVGMEQLESTTDAQPGPPAFIPLNEVLDHLPAVVVNDEHTLRALRHGHLEANYELMMSQEWDSRRPGPVRLIGPHQELVALWWPSAGAGERRLRVFASA